MDVHSVIFSFLRFFLLPPSSPTTGVEGATGVGVGGALSRSFRFFFLDFSTTGVEGVSGITGVAAGEGALLSFLIF